MVPFPPAEPRLAAILEANREHIVDRLAELEWAADPADPTRLVYDPVAVRPRAELFLDGLIAGLDRGDWSIFSAIAAITADVLRSGQRSVQQLNDRALAISSILIPLGTGAPDRDEMMVATFRTMQYLSGGIVATHHEYLLEQLRRLNELKSLFMRLTSHELRGPLTAANGYASLLAESSDAFSAAQTADMAQRISAASETALSLIDGLAEVASLEQEAGVLHVSRVRLHEIIDRAVDDVLPEATAKGVDIDRDVTDGMLDVDPERCVIAVRNLVANAVKYGARDAAVHVRAWIDERRCVEIEVEDEGPGIPDSEREKIFERYYRTRSSRDSGTPGSGLGLYIVRRIAELHGGEVQVSAAPLQGSRFRLTIPARTA